jgi:hypothetical protein
LTPATGRQDHTTSPYAKAPFVRARNARDDAAASTASRSNVRDDGQRPSSGTGRPLKATDLPRTQSRKYFVEGLDRILPAEVICPSCYFVAASFVMAGHDDDGTSSYRALRDKTATARVAVDIV